MSSCPLPSNPEFKILSLIKGSDFAIKEFHEKDGVIDLSKFSTEITEYYLIKNGIESDFDTSNKSNEQILEYIAKYEPQSIYEKIKTHLPKFSSVNDNFLMKMANIYCLDAETASNVLNISSLIEKGDFKPTNENILKISSVLNYLARFRGHDHSMIMSENNLSTELDFARFAYQEYKKYLETGSSLDEFAEGFEIIKNVATNALEKSDIAEVIHLMENSHIFYVKDGTSLIKKPMSSILIKRYAKHFAAELLKVAGIQTAATTFDNKKVNEGITNLFLDANSGVFKNIFDQIKRIESPALRNRILNNIDALIQNREKFEREIRQQLRDVGVVFKEDEEEEVQEDSVTQELGDNAVHENMGESNEKSQAENLPLDLKIYFSFLPKFNADGSPSIDRETGLQEFHSFANMWRTVSELAQNASERIDKDGNVTTRFEDMLRILSEFSALRPELRFLVEKLSLLERDASEDNRNDFRNKFYNAFALTKRQYLISNFPMNSNIANPALMSADALSGISKKMKLMSDFKFDSQVNLPTKEELDLIMSLYKKGETDRFINNVVHFLNKAYSHKFGKFEKSLVSFYMKKEINSEKAARNFLSAFFTKSSYSMSDSNKYDHRPGLTGDQLSTIDHAYRLFYYKSIQDSNLAEDKNIGAEGKPIFPIVKEGLADRVIRSVRNSKFSGNEESSVGVLAKMSRDPFSSVFGLGVKLLKETSPILSEVIKFDVNAWEARKPRNNDVSSDFAVNFYNFIDELIGKQVNNSSRSYVTEEVNGVKTFKYPSTFRFLQAADKSPEKMMTIFLPEAALSIKKDFRAGLVKTLHSFVKAEIARAQIAVELLHSNPEDGSVVLPVKSYHKGKGIPNALKSFVLGIDLYEDNDGVYGDTIDFNDDKQILAMINHIIDQEMAHAKEAMKKYGLDFNKLNYRHQDLASKVLVKKEKYTIYENGKKVEKLLNGVLTNEGNLVTFEELFEKYVAYGIQMNLSTLNAFSIDPAFFKTSVETVKRWTMTVSPTKPGLTKSPTFKIGILKDIEEDSGNLYRDLVKMHTDTFGSKQQAERIYGAFEKNNKADAQGYATLDRYVDLLKSQGLIDNSYDALIEKLKDENTDITALPFTEKQLINKLFLSPQKPFHASSGLRDPYEYGDMKVQGMGNTLVPIMLKYSVVPIIPAIHKNTELMKVHEAMISQGIDEVLFESAVKIGSQGAVDFNKLVNGEAHFYPITLENEYHGLQQLTPNKYAAGKDSRPVGIQGKKIIRDVMHDEVYYVDENGKNVTGKDFLESIDKDQEAINKFAQAEYHKKIGVSVEVSTNESGDTVYTYDVKDVEAFNKAIFKHFKNIDGVTRTDIEDLSNWIKHNVGTRLTLESFGMNSSRMFREAISSFNKSVLNPSLPGGSMVQVSPVGYKYMTNSEKSGIFFFDGKTPTEDLLPPSPGKAGQCLVPFSMFKDIKGFEDMSYDDLVKFFSKKENREAINKAIGYRIPTQKLSSIDSLEIVGILPPVLGDSIVLYPSITGKTGSDYDIDKMFMVFKKVSIKNREIYKTPKGETRKVKTIKDKETGEVKYYAKASKKDGFLLYDKKTGQLSKDGDGILKKVVVDGKEEAHVIDGFVSRDGNDFSIYVKVNKENVSNEIYLSTNITGDRNINNIHRHHNSMFDSMYKMLNSTNEKAYLKKMAPVDSYETKNVYAKGILANINNVDEEFFDMDEFVNKPLVRIMNPVEQLIIKADNMDGQDGIALTANHQNAAAIDNAYGVQRVVDTILMTEEASTGMVNEKGSTFKAGKYSPEYVVESISAFLNGFVDMAKDPFLSYININKKTAPYLFSLIRGGMHPYKAMRFLAQPGLRTMMKLDNSVLFNESVNDDIKEIASFVFGNKYTEILNIYSEYFKINSNQVSKALLYSYMSSNEIGEGRFAEIADRSDINIFSFEGLENNLKETSFEAQFLYLCAFYSLGKQAGSLTNKASMFKYDKINSKGSIDLNIRLSTTRTLAFTSSEETALMKEGTYIKGMYDLMYNFENTNKMQSVMSSDSIMMYIKDRYRSVFDSVKNNEGTQRILENSIYASIFFNNFLKTNLDAETYNKVKNDFVSMITLNEGTIEGAAYSLIADNFRYRMNTEKIGNANKFVIANEFGFSTIPSEAQLDDAKRDFHLLPIEMKWGLVIGAYEQFGFAQNKRSLGNIIPISFLLENGLNKGLIDVMTGDRVPDYSLIDHFVTLSMKPQVRNVARYSFNNNVLTPLSKGSNNTNDDFVDAVFENRASEKDEIDSIENSERKARFVSDMIGGEVIVDPTISGWGQVTYDKNGTPLIKVRSLNHLTKDTLIHELAHVFIDISEGIDSDLAKDAYDQAMQTDIADIVAKEYPEFVEGSEMHRKEVLAQALGLKGSEMFDNMDDSLFGKIKEWVNYVFENVKKLLGINYDATYLLSRKMLNTNLADSKKVNVDVHQVFQNRMRDVDRFINSGANIGGEGLLHEPGFDDVRRNILSLANIITSATSPGENSLNFLIGLRESLDTKLKEIELLNDNATVKSAKMSEIFSQLSNVVSSIKDEALNERQSALDLAKQLLAIMYTAKDLTSISDSLKINIDPTISDEEFYNYKHEADYYIKSVGLLNEIVSLFGIFEMIREKTSEDLDNLKNSAKGAETAYKFLSSDEITKYQQLDDVLEGKINTFFDNRIGMLFKNNETKGFMPNVLLDQVKALPLGAKISLLSRAGLFVDVGHNLMGQLSDKITEHVGDDVKTLENLTPAQQLAYRSLHTIIERANTGRHILEVEVANNAMQQMIDKKNAIQDNITRNGRKVAALKLASIDRTHINADAEFARERYKKDNNIGIPNKGQISKMKDVIRQVLFNNKEKNFKKSYEYFYKNLVNGEYDISFLESTFLDPMGINDRLLGVMLYDLLETRDSVRTSFLSGFREDADLYLGLLKASGVDNGYYPDLEAFNEQFISRDIDGNGVERLSILSEYNWMAFDIDLKKAIKAARDVHAEEAALIKQRLSMAEDAGDQSLIYDINMELNEFMDKEKVYVDNAVKAFYKENLKPGKKTGNVDANGKPVYENEKDAYGRALPNSNWLSPKYAALSPEQKAYVNMLERELNTANAYVEKGNQLRNNEIPFASKSSKEILRAGNIKDGVGEFLKEKFKNDQTKDMDISVQTQELLEGIGEAAEDAGSFVRTDINGDIIQRPPLRFRHKIPNNERSLDLFRIIKANKYMSMNYGEMSKKMAQMSLYGNFLKDQKIAKRDSKGRIFKKKFFNEALYVKKETERYKVFQSIFNQLVLGNTRGDYIIKGISVGKTISTITGLATNAILGYNWPGGAVNLSVGLLQAHNHFYADIMSNNNSFGDAFAEYMKSMGQMRKETSSTIGMRNSKINVVADLINLKNDFSSSFVEEIVDIKKIRTNLGQASHSPYAIGEHMISSVMMIAKMKNILCFAKGGAYLHKDGKSTTEDASEAMNLWDALDDQGNLNPMVESTDVNYLYDVNNKSKMMFEISSVVNNIIFNAQGYYGKEVKSKIETSVGGGAVVSLRKWAARGVNKWFRGVSTALTTQLDDLYDPYKETYHEQFVQNSQFSDALYTGMVSAVILAYKEQLAADSSRTKTGRVFNSMFRTLFGTNDESLSELALFGTRKARHTMAVAVSSYVIASLAALGGGEGDDESNNPEWFAAYLSIRIFNEFTYFANFNELTRSFNNVSHLFDYFKNLSKFVLELHKLDREGNPKAGKNFFKITNIDNAFIPFGEDYFRNKYNFIKNGGN